MSHFTPVSTSKGRSFRVPYPRRGDVRSYFKTNFGPSPPQQTKNRSFLRPRGRNGGLKRIRGPRPRPPVYPTSSLSLRSTTTWKASLDPLNNVYTCGHIGGGFSSVSYKGSRVFQGRRSVRTELSQLSTTISVSKYTDYKLTDNAGPPKPMSPRGLPVSQTVRPLMSKHPPFPCYYV